MKISFRRRKEKKLKVFFKKHPLTVKTLDETPFLASDYALGNKKKRIHQTK